MSQNNCDCCQGTEILTPANTANRPGLNRLAYRVGTQAAFLETMKARLAATFVEEPPQNVKDWSLKATDIRSLAKFLLRLKGAGDPLTYYLRGQFAAELSQQLGDYDGQTEPEADLTALLLAEINEVLGSVSLYRPGIIGHLNLSQPVHNLARQETLTPDDLLRLNRLILEAGYPDLIVPRQRVYPLQTLTTRETSDPSLAMLDAWATVADVLTFYQERIANEGYLPTAGERRSILELARLVGYKLRPGVAATVYLAFTMEDGYTGEIPAGTRAQSVPDPGETAQFFETEEPLPARAEWNEMQPRLQRPLPLRFYDQADLFPYLYFQGTALNLNPGDPLLFMEGQDASRAILHFIEKVDIENAANRTRIKLQGAPKEAGAAFRRAAAAIVGDYLNLAKHEISAGTQMAQRVVKLLGTLQQNLTPEKTAVDLTADVNALLPKLQKEQAIAIEGQYSKLEPWVSGLVADLTGVTSHFAMSIPAPGGVETPALSKVEVAVSNPTAAFARSLSSDNGKQREGPISLLKLDNVLEAIAKPPSLQPRSARKLTRTIGDVLDPRKDIVPRMLANLRPATAQHLYQAWQNLTLTQPADIHVYALRVKAAPFGHSAPLKVTSIDDGAVTFGEWDINTGQDPGTAEITNVVWLDNTYEKIQPDSWIVVKRPFPTKDDIRPQIIITQAAAAGPQSRADYGLSAKSTRLELGADWLVLDDLDQLPPDDFKVVRGTAVYAQSEELTLADAPIETAIGPVEGDEETGKTIELARLYDGLEAGRWLVVYGEREDVVDEGAAVAGVQGSELVMLAGVEQSWDDSVPGEKPHTTIILANNLAYRYKRDTVTINANVAKASHGETISEVLGSGNGSQKFQTFSLKRPPLTHLSAPTSVGSETTLETRVNNIRWHEAGNLSLLKPNDRRYTTQTDDEGKTSLIFGNGKRGARLPTGVENVTAVYRSGIGLPGNVKANQIKLLATRPLGVKSVINPIRASGGGDPEDRDQARRNTPLPLLALDRLVSVRDYADFARSFAGIAKAQAARLSDGRQLLIYVTIAGEKDAPIDKTSDLYRNLRQAFYRLGDPFLPLQIEPRELALLVISAKVRLHPDYLWEAVEPEIRQSLLTTFGFDARSLGQDVMLSEVFSAIQQVPGVVYADVDTFGAIPEKRAAADGRRVALSPTEIAAVAQKLVAQSQPSSYPEPVFGKALREVGKSGLPPYIPVNLANVEKGGLRPAQIAYLSPNLPDTLILTEIL